MAEQTQKRRRPSAKETRARMARAVGSESPITRAPEPDPEPEEEPQATAAERTETPRQRRAPADEGGRLVRLSVDVVAGEHRALRILAAQISTTGMGVMRALLQEALEDPELAKRVSARLAGE